MYVYALPLDGRLCMSSSYWLLRHQLSLLVAFVCAPQLSLFLLLAGWSVVVRAPHLGSFRLLVSFGRMCPFPLQLLLHFLPVCFCRRLATSLQPVCVYVLRC